MTVENFRSLIKNLLSNEAIVFGPSALLFMKYLNIYSNFLKNLNFDENIPVDVIFHMMEWNQVYNHAKEILCRTKQMELIKPTHYKYCPFIKNVLSFVHFFDDGSSTIINIYNVKMKDISYIYPLYSLNTYVMGTEKNGIVNNFMLDKYINITRKDSTDLKFYVTSIHNHLLFEKCNNKVSYFGNTTNYDTNIDRITKDRYMLSVIKDAKEYMATFMEIFKSFIEKDVYIPLDIRLKNIEPSEYINRVNDFSSTKYKSNKSNTIAKRILNDECAICLDKINTSKIFITNCDHIFHSTCFMSYIIQYYSNLCDSILNGRKLIRPDYDIDGYPINITGNEKCPICRKILFTLKKVRFSKYNNKIIFDIGKFNSFPFFI